MDFGWWGQIYFLMRWMRYSDSNKKCLIWVLEFSQICHNGLTKSDLMKNVLTLIAKLPSQQHFLRKVKVDFISAKVAFQEAQIAFLGKFFFSPSFCCFFFRIFRKILSGEKIEVFVWARFCKIGCNFKRKLGLRWGFGYSINDCALHDLCWVTSIWN